MFLYLSIVAIAVVVISVLNIVFVSSYPFDNYALWIIVATVLSTVAEIVFELLIAGIVEWLPSKCYKKDGWLYMCTKKESLFYDKLKIRSWKERIPELGSLCGFRKNKIQNPNDPEYISRFIEEAKKAVVIHIVCGVLGFLVIFILPLKYWWRIGLPVGIVSFVLNIMPVLVQRYNIPKLKVLEKRAIRNASRRKSSTETKEDTTSVNAQIEEI